MDKMTSFRTRNQRSVISFKYLKSSKVHRRNNKQKEHKTTENIRKSNKIQEKQQNTRKTTQNIRNHYKIIRKQQKITYIKDNFLQKITENNRKIRKITEKRTKSSENHQKSRENHQK